MFCLQGQRTGSRPKRKSFSRTGEEEERGGGSGGGGGGAGGGGGGGGGVFLSLLLDLSTDKRRLFGLFGPELCGKYVEPAEPRRLEEPRRLPVRLKGGVPIGDVDILHVLLKGK